MKAQIKQIRRPGHTRLSAQHQVTIPVAALRRAGIRPGDAFRAEVPAPGRILLVREDDPIERHAGALTGIYRPGELNELRDEWD